MDIFKRRVQAKNVSTRERGYAIAPPKEDSPNREVTPKYLAFLKAGSKRNGTYTARETGARQMAAQGEVVRLQGKLQTLKRAARIRKQREVV